MYVIVGLGNPGHKYKNNRHNVGQMFIDYLVKELTNPRINEFKLVKTDCFMNQSGAFVKKLIENFKLKIENLVVVHDDLDIPLGKFKIQKGVGPKLHNGIESIEKALATKPSFARQRRASEGKDFWRIRIGVDNRPAKKIMYLHHDRGKNTSLLWIDGETYVLQDFDQAEKNLLVNEVFPKIYARLSSKFLINASTTTR